ncbi:DUF4352 domain-containing protein [Micromonospora sp. NBC_01638]|uniref:DUF4352 domain-containing protein n=1 Tax=Micromonospora sp. NBC_01638 TaxID=2975982 RepID=UPI003868ACD6|nr:DUF4352 domain-containing protein [Micromonospora sp. NBC_01638]
MTHPQPPVGPQDPQQPNVDPPTDPYPATPQPPFSGAAYAGAGSGYAGAGSGYRVPGVPGYPLLAPPPVQSKGAKKTVVVVAVTAAVLTLLSCAGGIVAVVIGASRTAPTVSEALPTPDVPRGVGQPPATAPSSTPPPIDDDTRNMSPGDTLVLDGDDGTVEITVTKFRSATKPCTSRGLKPDEGMYVIADVTVAVTKGTASSNPLFFHWVAADGTKTTAIGGALSGCGKPMPASNDLAAGTKRTGSVVFDVPDTSGALEYQHQFKTAGSWKP